MKYFEVFNIKPKFLLDKDDVKKMEETFLFLQKQTQQEDVVNLQSRVINEAYSILQDDVKRISYILQNLDIDILEIKMKKELVESIVELREDLEDSETEEELKTKLNDVMIELEEVKQNLDEEVSKAITQTNYKKDSIVDLFCEFRGLIEISKKYKHHKL